MKVDLNTIRQRLEELGAELVEFAVEQMPGATDEQQIEAATEAAWKYFEQNDHLIPFIGPFMDLPAADLAQRVLVRPQVRAFIERAHAEGKKDRK